MGNFIRKQWIFLGQSNSFVSEFVKSPEFYSWLNVDGLCGFFETPVFLPGESQGRGSLVGCRLWGCTESDTTEAT